MLRSQPFYLILIIAALMLCQSYIPQHLQQQIFAVSLTIKSMIIFILPVIVFSLLFKTMVNLNNRATTVIGLILLCVMCSNFIATYLSHFAGMLVNHLHMNLIVPHPVSELQPAWQFALPKLMNNNIAMFSGIFGGIILSRIYPLAAHVIAKQLERLTHLILQIFKIIIPVFVAGFVVKLQADGVVTIIIKDYALIFALIALAQFSYLLLVYASLNKFNFKDTLQGIKNMFPAAIAGFSAMSSAAVMPLTIAGVSANTQNKNLAKSVVPSTVNIHLLGDCIAIPIFAYALLNSFGMPEPGFMAYVLFTCYFVIAKFSVAAVPGGGILVMLPILESHLGFNAAMLSMITALYILFDPIITCANVLGNGAFAKLIADFVIPEPN